MVSEFTAREGPVFNQDPIPPKELVMSTQQPKNQVASNNARILVIRDERPRFFDSSNVQASLRSFSVITDGAGSLTAEYGNTLFPRDERYEFGFPRDIEKHRGNIDYRDETGVYFIMPISGTFYVFSESADLPDTYINHISYVNLKFEHQGQEVTINGTGEATFVFQKSSH